MLVVLHINPDHLPRNPRTYLNHVSLYECVVGGFVVSRMKIVQAPGHGGDYAQSNAYQLGRTLAWLLGLRFVVDESLVSHVVLRIRPLESEIQIGRASCRER